MCVLLLYFSYDNWWQVWMFISISQKALSKAWLVRLSIITVDWIIDLSNLFMVTGKECGDSVSAPNYFYRCGNFVVILQIRGTYFIQFDPAPRQAERSLILKPIKWHLLSMEKRIRLGFTKHNQELSSISIWYVSNLDILQTNLHVF